MSLHTIYYKKRTHDANAQRKESKEEKSGFDSLDNKYIMRDY